MARRIAGSVAAFPDFGKAAYVAGAVAVPHRHVPARRVLLALAITVAAAAIELLGSRTGGSLFLAADAVHLLAHVGIFGVLLMPSRWWHERWEDVTAVAVLALVTVIATGVTLVSLRALRVGEAELPRPAIMLLSLFGLVANVVAAWLLTPGARQWWSFRAALAHELSDAALTLVGLVGAGAIAVFGWTWVDPSLSLAIGLWLGGWALRLLGRRVRQGRRIWAEEPR
jgi:cobalt-zinc-cadmium efflux system protein